MSGDQDLADDIRSAWFSDPHYRAKWREYMRENEESNVEYCRTNGGRHRAATPWSPDLTAHLAQRRTREARTRAIIQQRRGDRGASAVEYGMMVAAIAAVLAGTVFALGGTVQQAFTKTCDAVGSYASIDVTNPGCDGKVVQVPPSATPPPPPEPTQ